MKIIVSHSHMPEFNLAAEEYLFSKREEEWIFLYVNVPSVIIGSNQAVMNEVDFPFCLSEEIAIIRRLSGGGAVYHDEGNLNYCFISYKTDHPLGVHFLLPVIGALRAMEIPVEMGKRKDLWLGGFKISGTASHVSKGRELHHGTLLYDTDLEKLQKALNPAVQNLEIKASRSVASPVKNISVFLSENRKRVFPANIFFHRFTQKIMELHQLTEVSSFLPDDIQAIERIRTQKYAVPEWNYRM